jgi:hypothetical protein
MNSYNSFPGKVILNQEKDNNLTQIIPGNDNIIIKAEDIQADADYHFQLAFEAKDKQTNCFPVDVFPLKVQKIISATNENLNFPIDFIGASMLFTVSVAVGNTHKVEVKKGWLESSVLYLAIVARAGTNKSHPLSWALQPIVDHDKGTYRVYEQQRKDYEKSLSLSKKERKQQAIDEPTKPIWQKFLLSDFTPEALAEVHKFNKRGIGVYVDELAGWFKNFNRYNKGSEMEFWLSAWSGKPINIDRKTGEPIFIPLPYIPVAGTIQNGLLNELAKDSRIQNGFIDRILFVIPDNIQKPYWSDTELNPVFAKEWKGIITKLLSLLITNDETLNPLPDILFFSPEAKLILFEWQKKNTDQSNDPENEEVSGIYSKLEMYVVRLALLLEMMRYACDENDKRTISIEAMQGAIKLIEYFKKSALKVNSIISNVSPLEKYPDDKQALYKALPDTFKTEMGLQVAKNREVPERTFKRFLSDKNLFTRISRGEYEKQI